MLQKGDIKNTTFISHMAYKRLGIGRYGFGNYLIFASEIISVSVN